MAEGFARTYGADALIPASAGLHPAGQVARDSIRAMEEKGIDIRQHFPKSIKHLSNATFDLVVNISGVLIPESLTKPAKVQVWEVDDPVSRSYQKHCDVRDEIEKLVMNLILDLRRAQQLPKFRGQGSGN